MCFETLDLRNTLIRAKRVNKKWRIRHKLTQTIHPLGPNLPTFNHKKIHSVAQRKRGRFIKVNFNGSKLSQGATRDFIIRNWEGKFI